MKRRAFTKKIVGGAGAAAIFGGINYGHSAEKKFLWRMVMVVPKTLPIWGPGMVRFAENVESMSQGRLKIRVYGAGELVPALETFEAVKKGQVQMGHSASYYWQGKIPASVYFTSVPFGMNANGMTSWILAGGGLQLWDELYAKHNLKPFPCGNTGVQMGGWFKKEINSLEDLKGLKMRMPGLGGSVISKAGAKPVLLAQGDIFPSLQTGVIDATEWVGPYHDYLMGFHKIAPYYYTGGWHEPGSVLELIINKDAWDSLPPDLQQIVSCCAIETNTRMFSEWGHMDSMYYKKLQEEGQVKFKEYPEEITRTMHRFADEVLEEVAAADELSGRIHQSFKSFQKTFEAYQEVSERAYVKAQKA